MNKKQKIQDAAKAIMASAIVVPMMGVVAHFLPGKGVFWDDNASLSHRFETAYNINANPAHKTYMSYEWIDQNRIMQDAFGKPFVMNNGFDYVIDNTLIGETYGDKVFVSHLERYSTNPYIVYPMHLLVAAGAYASMRRRRMMDMARGANVRTK